MGGVSEIVIRIEENEETREYRERSMGGRGKQLSMNYGLWRDWTRGESRWNILRAKIKPPFFQWFHLILSVWRYGIFDMWRVGVSVSLWDGKRRMWGGNSFRWLGLDITTKRRRKRRPVFISLPTLKGTDTFRLWSIRYLRNVRRERKRGFPSLQSTPIVLCCVDVVMSLRFGCSMDWPMSFVNIRQYWSCPFWIEVIMSV